MKTILYQPLFINPQAYFVFPQLYHIEKGDSYIEPANITGQLIINTLTDDPTLTPTILTIKDNNQVDFSIFAGKHKGFIMSKGSDTKYRNWQIPVIISGVPVHLDNMNIRRVPYILALADRYIDVMRWHGEQRPLPLL